MSKNLYIAGPMTGYPNFNFDAFMAAEEEFKEYGYDVDYIGHDDNPIVTYFDEIFNPARKDIETYGDKIHTDNATGDAKLAADKHGFSLRDALGKDLAFICSKATHIYMLKGWEKSRGATAEHATAVALGLEIVYQ